MVSLLVEGKFPKSIMIEQSTHTISNIVSLKLINKMIKCLKYHCQEQKLKSHHITLTLSRLQLRAFTFMYVYIYYIQNQNLLIKKYLFRSVLNFFLTIKWLFHCKSSNLGVINHQQQIFYVEILNYCGGGVLFQITMFRVAILTFVHTHSVCNYQKGVQNIKGPINKCP